MHRRAKWSLNKHDVYRYMWQHAAVARYIAKLYRTYDDIEWVRVEAAEIAVVAPWRPVQIGGAR